MKELSKHLKGKWSNFDDALVLIQPITAANISITGVPIVGFLVQSMIEVDHMVALVEVDMYTVVVVLDAVAVRTHTSDQKYRDWYCGPSMGLKSHEDLVVALAPDSSTTVVVVVDTRVMEVLQTNYFRL